jgi:hypothetical protein
MAELVTSPYLQCGSKQKKEECSIYIGASPADEERETYKVVWMN